MIKSKLAEVVIILFISLTARGEVSYIAKGTSLE